MVFAPRPWQGRADLRVRQRSAKRADPSGNPEGENRESGGQPGDLKPETGENPCSHHVRDDDAGRGERRDRVFAFGDSSHSAIHVEGEGRRVNDSEIRNSIAPNEFIFIPFGECRMFPPMVRNFPDIAPVPPPGTVASALPPGLKYWAFVSYSHRDEHWAKWVHEGIETYRIPRSLVGNPLHGGLIPRRMFPLFRDRDELPGAAELGTQIHGALESSLYLIVICSPRAAVSRWVNQEVQVFKALGREDRVLCLVVDGEPNADPNLGELECFPPAVRFKVDSAGGLTSESTEPIAADARTGKDGKANAMLKVLAGMLNVGFDQLHHRERRRTVRRQIRWALGGMLAALGLFVGYIALADVGVGVPGGASIRSLIDRFEASYFGALLRIRKSVLRPPRPGSRPPGCCWTFGEKEMVLDRKR